MDEYGITRFKENEMLDDEEYGEWDKVVQTLFIPVRKGK